MFLFVFDGFAWVICLAIIAFGLKLAWDFGFWSGHKKECLSSKMIALFASIAWLGLCISIAAAIKILHWRGGIPTEIAHIAITFIRLAAFIPLLWAVYKFNKFVTKTRQSTYTVKMDRKNGNTK